MLRILCLSFLFSCTHGKIQRPHLTSPSNHAYQPLHTHYYASKLIPVFPPIFNPEPVKFKLYTYSLTKKSVNVINKTHKICYTYVRTPYHRKFNRRKNKRYALKYTRTLSRNDKK